MKVNQSTSYIYKGEIAKPLQNIKIKIYQDSVVNGLLDGMMKLVYIYI